ncbi:MAG: serine hydrolase [Candidatus Magasanikbacteria bacterium]
MKQSTFSLVAIFAVLALFMPSIALFASEFNPNFIISDEELQDADTMSRADIQAFLNEKSSFLKSFKAEDVDGIPRLAADIISRAAQEHTINPKYLLVKLQKEQSLITDPDPTQKALDGATGYGISDGCGWDCDMYTKNKGFGKQVDSAAGIMRWYYDHMVNETWIKTAHKSYNIDGQIITPQSDATGFLYTYTPHIQGNENFWKLWQKWFEQVYPDSTLVKTTDSPTVYVIQDGTKRSFDSMTALISRFDPKMIITVPPSELARYTTGNSIALPNYAILQKGGSYYLLDFDTLRPFESYETVKQLGYHPDEIIPVTETDIDEYRIGSTIKSGEENPLGKLAMVKENGSIYYISNGIYHPVLDKAIANINFPHLTLETIRASELSGLERGSNILIKNGTLFGITGSNKIYAVEHSKKRHIVSEKIFDGLGYSWGNIVWMNDFAGMAHQTGEPIYLKSEVTDIVNPPKPVTPPVIAETSTPEQVAGIKIEKEVAVMVTTPESEISFLGKQFNTPVDGYIVADYETGEILAGKNLDTVRPLASLTKVMGGYVLFDKGLNLQYISTYDENKHRAQYHYIKLANGDMVRNRDLIKDMMIRSYNTPSYMLVDSIGLSPTIFVKNMNEQANAWGLSKTSFVDPYGGGVDNQSTIREYNTLFVNALKNQEIKTLLGTVDYEYTEVKDTDDQPYHYKRHTNNLVREADLSFNIIASKTGYIDEAGANLAMLIERKTDGKKFVTITMGNSDYSGQFNEPEKLAAWTIQTF